MKAFLEEQLDLPQLTALKLLLTELARGEYIDKREDLLLVGNSGTGKSHLAIALGIAACGQGKRVRFIRVTTALRNPAARRSTFSPPSTNRPAPGFATRQHVCKAFSK